MDWIASLNFVCGNFMFASVLGQIKSDIPVHVTCAEQFSEVELG